MAKIGDHAVVLGASMAGLLAARTLSDSFETVMVVERDVLPDDAANRLGVPQGRHLHALLARGAQVLEEFFPAALNQFARVTSLVDPATRLLRPSMVWRAALAKHRRRLYEHQTDDPTGMVEISVI